MKDSPYLTHDIGARNDPKLIDVQMEMKGQGLAIWWCLVEMLWENDGYLPMNFKSIAFNLRWATAEEVEKVICDFGLFENDGEKFWSRSALERITHKQEVSKTKAAAGRRGAAVTNGRRAAATAQQNDGSAAADAEHMPDTSDGSAAADPPAINKSINQSINQSRNFSIPPTAAERQRLFQVFFFDLNFNNPEYEVGRFIEHYGGRGWVFGDGQPVVDLYAAAKNWKPEDTKKRFPQDFLNWYKTVYACAIGRLEDRESLLTELVKVAKNGRTLDLTYKSREKGLPIMKFVQDNDLAGGWQINWKVAN